MKHHAHTAGYELHQAGAQFASLGKQGPFAVLFIVALIALVLIAVGSGAKKIFS